MSENENVMKITSIEDLQAIARGTVVRLPDFAEGVPFVARLKRPSMFALAKNGKIPNELLVSANTLFEEGTQGGFDAMDKTMLQKCCDVFEIVCDASFVEPSYQQLKDAGVVLTDEQMLFVFNYTQQGVRQLDSFRQ